jgi:hypothetical protein
MKARMLTDLKRTYKTTQWIPREYR